MDDDSQGTTVDNRRDSPRVDMGEQVTISFDGGTIIGPGQNISAEGVFFVAEASLLVHVRLQGVEREVPAELVRLQTMGEGTVGIAVRFLEPQVQLSNDD